MEYISLHENLQITVKSHRLDKKLLRRHICISYDQKS